MGLGVVFVARDPFPKSNNTKKSSALEAHSAN